MDATAASFDADGMLEVKHLVIEKVFDGAAWSVGPVEDSTDNDGVVGSVVVAKHAAGVMRGPCQRRTAEESVEETSVERVEDLVEVVVVPHVGKDAFAAAGLANVFGLFGDGLGGDVATVAIGVVA